MADLVDEVRGFAPARVTAHIEKIWGTDLEESVVRVATVIAPSAVLLPFTAISGRLVRPVVYLDEREVGSRAANGTTAILDRERIAADVELGETELPASPLKIAAFLSVKAIPLAARDLAGLRAYARTVVLVPTGRNLAKRWANELDVQGTAIFEANPLHCGALVPGDRGVHPGASIPPFWTRLREEQLFDLYLGSNQGGGCVRLPCCPPCAEVVGNSKA